MKTTSLSLILLVVLGIFINDTTAQSTDSIPAMMLSNWFDSTLSWATSRGSFTEQPSKNVGVFDYRIADNWNYSAIKTDTFALIIGNEYYTDPKLWDGDSYLRDDGVFQSTYNKYDGKSLSFSVVCEIIQPAYAPHYVIRYRVNDPKVRSFQLLSYLIADSNSPSTKTWGWFNSADNMFMADETKSGAFYFSSGAIDGYTTYQLGVPGSSTDPLKQFANGGTGALGMNDVMESQQVAIGIGVKGNGNQSFSFYRTYRKDFDAAVASSKAAANNNAAFWIAMTKSGVDNWLSNARMAPTFANEPFYKTSLLFLKHAQNPTVGTIVASFHPAYEFKVWMRDGMYAAMILDAAGYTVEARMFYTWGANNDLADGNHFHTCYSYWTGAEIGFVEPQLDSAGQYLLAMLYHLSLARIKANETGDSSLVSEAKAFLNSSPISKRIGVITDYFVGTKGAYNLAPADYSIWEESSSQVDGSPLPIGYYAYTQGMAWAGLTAASRIYNEIYKNTSKYQLVKARADELKTAIETNMWDSTKNIFVRQIWSDTLEKDLRVDASSASLLWTGLIKNSTRIESHRKAINSVLMRDTWGLARYDGDIYFYASVFNPAGRECVNDMPAWPLVTLMNSWLDNASDRLKRLNWTVERAAYHSMPVGEAVDGDVDQFIWSSSPDIYEHAGIYVITCLIHDGLIPQLKPEDLVY